MSHQRSYGFIGHPGAWGSARYPHLGAAVDAISPELQVIQRLGSSIVDASSIDPIKGDWIEVDTREKSSMVSTWTERLCLRRRPPGFQLAICIYGAVGELMEQDDEEVAGEETQWRDEGRLPAFFEGHFVSSMEDGLLCGPLQVFPGDAYELLPNLSESELRKALISLGWDHSNEVLQSALRASIPRSPYTALDPRLIAAYALTIFRAFAAPPIDLRIGEESEPLRSLLGGRRSGNGYLHYGLEPSKPAA